MIKKGLKNKIRAIISAISLFFLAFLLLCSSIMGEWGKPLFASADGAQKAAFEKTDVLDDLTTMTIDGKPFSLKDYGFDTRKETNVLTVAEYCYSFDTEKQDNYGLYIYVHNPKALEYVDDVRNQVSLRVNGAGSYQKYDLELLSVCELADFERLFYKFAVRFTETEETAILSSVQSAQRIYEISEIELRESGNTGVQAYNVSSIYRYQGYAKGYGANVSADSTLRMSREDSETITLDVHSTYYRPDGNNGKNAYTQDSLHSVYFAVPNKYIEKYGEMTAVHATWREAVLKPMLVIDTELYYNVCQDILSGRYVGTHDDSLNWAFMGGAYEANWNGSLMVAELGYNVNSNLAVYPSLVGAMSNTQVNEVVPIIYDFFYGDKDTSLSSADIMSRIGTSYARFGGEPVYGADYKYSSNIFESIADDYTDVNIGIDDKYELTNIVISQTWWEDLWNIPGTEVEYTSTFDGIKAIEAVDVENLSRDTAIDSTRYYFDESDCNDFYSYVDEYSADNTIYFFRYRTSEYQAYDMTMYKEDTFMGIAEYDQIEDVGGYFFRSAFDIDFDVIDVTFTTDEIDTVIGCVMSPMDIIHDATPPLAGSITDDDNDDNDGLPWWVWLIIIILVLIVVGVFVKPVMTVIIWIVKGVWWLICAPFRFIRWIFRKIRGDSDD